MPYTLRVATHLCFYLLKQCNPLGSELCIYFNGVTKGAFDFFEAKYAKKEPWQLCLEGLDSETLWTD